MSPDRDPGLQPERTALAWRRTGLSAGLVSVVLALALVRLDLAPLAVGAALLAVITAVIAMTWFPGGSLAERPNHAWPALTRIVAVVLGIASFGAAAATVAIVEGLSTSRF